MMNLIEFRFNQAYTTNKSFALKIITPIPWLHQLSGGLAWAATRTLYGFDLT